MPSGTSSTAGTNSSLNTDTTGDSTVTAAANSASAGVTRALTNGASVSALVGVDLINLLTQGGASSLGLSADTSVSIPLLRGSGRYIVMEPLTQAERNVVYRIWEFEHYKRSFAVNIASNYLSVLRQIDSLKNSESNYRSSIYPRAGLAGKAMRADCPDSGGRGGAAGIVLSQRVDFGAGCSWTMPWIRSRP